MGSSSLNQTVEPCGGSEAAVFKRVRFLGGDEGIAEELREEIVEDFSRKWSEVVEASVPKRLSTRRASERLTKARVAVSLDMPGKRPKGWKPKGVRVRYASRAKASLIAEAEAIVRADSELQSSEWKATDSRCRLGTRGSSYSFEEFGYRGWLWLDARPSC